MHLAKTIKIHPTQEQINVLWTISDFCRKIYNLAHEERDYCYQNKLKMPSCYDQQKSVTQYKKDHPEFKAVHSKIYQSIIGDLDNNYRSFYSLWKKDKTARPPGYKSYKYFTTIPYNQTGFKFKSGLLKLSHKVNNIPLEFEAPKEFELLDVKTLHIFNDKPYKAQGNWYIAITYALHDIKEYVDNGMYQAIDLGVTKLVTAVNSDGKFFEVKTPRNDKYWNPKINTAKSRRDHCKGSKKGQKKSKKYLCIDNAIKTMSRKLSNQNKDFAHKLSNKMVNNTKANTIIIGDLKIKQLPKNKKKTKQQKGLNRSTQGIGISRFVGFLTYKAELIGKKIIKIDEKYTTKECHICGKRHNMTLGNRIMKCDCGNVIDRDRNSAINIMKRYLSQNCLMDRLLEFSNNVCSGFVDVMSNNYSNDQMTQNHI